MKDIIMSVIKKRVVSAIYLITLFTFYGCNSEEFDEYSITSSFKQNPYDFVGEYHNEGLLYVLQSLKTEIQVETRSIQTLLLEEEIQRLTESYCERNILENKGIQYPFDVEKYTILNSFTLSNTRTISQDCSNKVQYYLNKLLKCIKNPRDIKSLDEFNQMISRYEQEILQSNLTEEEEAIILVSYAVGRYSLKFWLDVSDKSTSPVIKTRSESFSDWWSAKVTPAVAAIVEADILGAIAGATEGAIAGATGGTAVVPGPGTVTGAVSGAVAGGSTGAIYGSAVGGVVYFFSR